jgi:hypothetical protein
MAEEIDKEESLQELRLCLSVLAASGLDVKSPKFRNAKIQDVQKYVEDPEARKMLANEWTGACGL